MYTYVYVLSHFNEFYFYCIVHKVTYISNIHVYPFIDTVDTLIHKSVSTKKNNFFNLDSRI